ncbi:6-pyruvoyl trahydropterin synthase family protein [Derxia gummosa]|uniref:6-carboxy-5,6,7,8-tetrahydropterin synthase n=1 Tax=Derxia gummosa DSM 723 TaxID=1121388 RepID=A0A8B6X6H5_9BURK|nr:6-carboxytetrahydropterin synthase [Derxia gummosa]
MIYELTQEFFFDAAHTLERTIETDSSRRIHGHTYHVLVSLRGQPDPKSGMLMDLGYFRAALAKLRDKLDHRFLDEIPEIGPATLENLCAYVWRELEGELPAIARVTLERRAGGDRCTLSRD